MENTMSLDSHATAQPFNPPTNLLQIYFKMCYEILFSSLINLVFVFRWIAANLLSLFSILVRPCKYRVSQQEARHYQCWRRAGDGAGADQRKARHSAGREEEWTGKEAQSERHHERVADPRAWRRRDSSAEWTREREANGAERFAGKCHQW